MNNIIKELLDKGFRLELFKDVQGELCHQLPGFYKSSGVVLRDIENGVMAFSRYNQMDEIYEFRDLVYLNHRWWQSSKEKYDGWVNPEEDWLPYLIEEGLVKKIEEKLVRYE